MFNKSRPVHKLNLQKELQNKKEEIVKDILKAKHEAKDYRTQGYNFEVFKVFAYALDIFDHIDLDITMHGMTVIYNFNQAK